MLNKLKEVIVILEARVVNFITLCVMEHLF